jgi:hypothetical protein
LFLGGVVGVFGYQWYLGQNEIVVEEPTQLPSPIMDKTARWETYKNEKIGITLKYSSFNTPSEVINLKKSGEPVFIITDQINFDTDQLSICETYEENVCILPGKTQFQEENIKPILLDGREAINFFISAKVYEDSNVNGVLQVVQTINDKPIEIAMSIDGMGGKEEFELMLSTLKFLDGGEDVTEGWKTYRNEKYGFEFKHPSSWHVITAESGELYEHNFFIPVGEEPDWSTGEEFPSNSVFFCYVDYDDSSTIDDLYIEKVQARTHMPFEKVLKIQIGNLSAVTASDHVTWIRLNKETLVTLGDPPMHNFYDQILSTFEYLDE